MTSNKVTESTDEVSYYSNGIEGYTAVYNAKRDKRASDKRKRAARPRKPKPLPPLLEDATLIEKREREKLADFARYRREKKEYDAFLSAQLLRSEEFPILKRFVAATPKRNKIRVGTDKGWVGKVSSSKIVSLMSPYVEANRTFMAIIRIDLDKRFKSQAVLTAAFDELVRNGELACRPNVVVLGKGGKGGHALWFLPKKYEVWRSPDKRCRRAPIRLFDGVCRGIAAACAHLGADHNAPTMSMRTKNPCHPEHEVWVMNDTKFPTLEEWKEFVDHTLTTEKQARLVAEADSGFDVTASNLLFNEMGPAACKLMRQWFIDRAPILDSSDTEVVNALRDILAQRAISEGHDQKGAKRTALGCARWAVKTFDPAKISKTSKTEKSFGAARHLLTSEMDLRARQRAGAEWAHAKSVKRTVGMVSDAIRALSERGLKVTKSAVACESGLNRETVTERWDEAMKTAGSGVVKKVPAATGEQEMVDIRIGAVEPVRDSRVQPEVIRPLVRRPACLEPRVKTVADQIEEEVAKRAMRRSQKSLDHT